jgi:acyl-CoA oxidase
LTSPTPGSAKFMIGNVDVYAQVLVLMAQLYLKGECKGVHAFIVPIRSLGESTIPKGDPLPDVEIAEFGLNSNWNEVDNLWIRFKGLRIPRENLLNRLADVSVDGIYTSPFKTSSSLFAATMSELFVTRINYLGAPLLCVETALWASLRYSMQHRDYSHGIHTLENPIIQHSTHYSQLMDTLAKTVAVQFARNDLISRLSNTPKGDSLLPEFHATLYGLKAYFLGWAQIQLTQIRLICGGAGSILAHGFGQLQNHLDVFQAAEGDRIALYEQLGKYLISSTTKRFTQSGVGGLIFYGLEILSQHIISMNPLLSIVESNAEPNLSSHGFLIKALELRQKTTIRDVVAKLQNHITAPIPMNANEAWNECLPQIIAACNAFIEHYIFQLCYKQIKRFDENFPIDDSTVKKDENSPTKLSIEAVRDCLYTITTVTGLGFVKGDLQFFARNGLFSSKRCNAIEQAWMVNCQKMKEKHVELLLSTSNVIEEMVQVSHIKLSQAKL